MGRKAIAFRGTTQIYCINSTLCQVRDIIDPIPSSNNAEKRISLPLLLQLMSSGANFSMVCARVLSVWTTPPWTRCNIPTFLRHRLIFWLILSPKISSVNTPVIIKAYPFQPGSHKPAFTLFFRKHIMNILSCNQIQKALCSN